MNSLRAIVLLVIYSAFLSGSTFAAVVCDGMCAGKEARHIAFSPDSNLPLGECSEKEAFNNLPTEHRVHPSVRLNSSHQVNGKKEEAGSFREYQFSVLADRTFSRTPLPSVPLYLSFCVFRL